MLCYLCTVQQLDFILTRKCYVFPDWLVNQIYKTEAPMWLHSHPHSTSSDNTYISPLSSPIRQDRKLWLTYWIEQSLCKLQLNYQNSIRSKTFINPSIHKTDKIRIRKNIWSQYLNLCLDLKYHMVQSHLDFPSRYLPYSDGTVGFAKPRILVWVLKALKKNHHVSILNIILAL